MCPTIHFRLRLVEVARIERREDLVAVAVGQYAGAVYIFRRAGIDLQRCAMCRHLVEHLLAVHVFSCPDRLERRDRPDIGDIDAHQRPKDEVRHVRRGSPLPMACPRTTPGVRAMMTPDNRAVLISLAGMVLSPWNCGKQFGCIYFPDGRLTQFNPLTQQKSSASMQFSHTSTTLTFSEWS